MPTWFDFAARSFASLFPIVDPLGGISVFLALAAGASLKWRRIFALRIALYTILVLSSFIAIGQGLLYIFGLSLWMLQIAGGTVVFAAGWQVLNSSGTVEPTNESESSPDAESESESESEVPPRDISLIPMTIPMFAGPGAISMTIGLAGEAGTAYTRESAIYLSALIAAIATIAGFVYLCLRWSEWLLKVLGDGGIQVLGNVIGLFTLALGVRLIFTGTGTWLESLHLVAIAGD